MKFAPSIIDTQTTDFASFAWSRLRRFRNVEWVANRIVRIHTLGDKHHGNARSQARQIALCIEQAEQYFIASHGVGMLVKPLLVYYGAMSLATALILFLKDGNYRIEKLRQNFGRHGLKLTVLQDERISALDRLTVSEEGVGIFQVLCEAIGGDYVFAKHTKKVPGGSHYKPEVILYESPESYKNGLAGIDAAALISIYPDLYWHASKYDCQTTLVRFNVEKNSDKDEMPTYNFTVQPAAEQLIDSVRNAIFFPAEMYNNIDVTEFPSGFHLKVHQTYPKLFNMRFPVVYRDLKSRLYFSAKLPPMRQMAVIYALLFIFGMYSRYYPELWSKNIYDGSTIYLASFDILEMARQAFPLFVLQEFEFEMYHAGAF